MKKQVIVVESKGTTTIGKIVAENEAVIPKRDVVESAIEEGMRLVAAIASGESVDPTAIVLKECTACASKGVQPFHPLNEFSIVKKTGKPHSQCKKCRSDQACAWQKIPSVKVRRKGWQKAYHSTYNAAPKPKHDPALAIIEAQPETGLNSMFVAYDKK